MTEPPDAQQGRGLVPGAQSPGTCLSLGLHPAPRPPDSYSLNSFQFPVSRQAPLFFVPSPTPVRPPSPIPASCRGRSLSLAPRCLPTPSSFPPVSRLLSRIDFLPASLWTRSIDCRPHRDGVAAPGLGRWNVSRWGPELQRAGRGRCPSPLPMSPQHRLGTDPLGGRRPCPFQSASRQEHSTFRKLVLSTGARAWSCGPSVLSRGRDPAQRRRQTLRVT